MMRVTPLGSILPTAQVYPIPGWQQSKEDQWLGEGEVATLLYTEQQFEDASYSNLLGTELRYGTVAWVPQLIGNGASALQVATSALSAS